MPRLERTTSPDSPALHALCDALRRESERSDESAWPEARLHMLAEAGVFEWFLPQPWGGQGWQEPAITQGMIALGASCLTTTFVLTQRNAACVRLASSPNARFRRDFGPGLCDGSIFPTVAISHLTTSRQHVAKPAMQATVSAHGFRLEGYSAWVTGAIHADLIVVGAVTDDDRQILVALNPRSPGVIIPPAERLLALSGSQTGRLECHGVEISEPDIVAGPMPEIMKHFGGGAGGLQTSALAVGLADAGIAYLEHEAERREPLREVAVALRHNWRSLRDDLLRTAGGAPQCSREDLRGRANSLALRATQAAMVAAKGAGFVAAHPVGRWCREALFFLVWSCPQAVLAANLCELAMLESTE